MSVLLLSALLFSSAHAVDFFTEIGPQAELRVAGTWGRVIPVEGGWSYAFGRNGNYWVAPLTRGADAGDWTLHIDQEIQLTTHGELKDHAIRRCPDGTFLHLASANVEEPNDSAYVQRYDGDWAVVQSGVVEEREPGRAHNDMPLLCADVFTGTAFSGVGTDGKFFHIDPDLGIRIGPSTPREAHSTGASMLADPDGEHFYYVAASFEGDLLRYTYDADLNVVDTRRVPVVEYPGERTYWPQGLMRVGDYYLVAMMTRDNSNPGDDGDILLVVLDEEWTSLQARVNITENPPENMGMRPWLARSGSTLLVSYDRQREHTVIEVQLDLEAFGLSPGDDDTGWGDGTWEGGSDGDGGGADGAADGGEDSGSAAEAGDDKGCGCATGAGGGGAALGLIGLAALAWRRRE